MELSLIILQIDSLRKIESAKDLATNLYTKGYYEYGELLLGFLLGVTFAWIYHKIWGLRMLKQSHKNVLDTKDQLIKSLAISVNKQLLDIEPRKEDRATIKKIRAFFKSLYK